MGMTGGPPPPGGGGPPAGGICAAMVDEVPSVTDEKKLLISIYLGSVYHLIHYTAGLFRFYEVDCCFDQLLCSPHLIVF